MTFGQGPLLLQKYKILPKRRKKNHAKKVSLKVDDRNTEGLNIICPDDLFCTAHCT